MIIDFDVGGVLAHGGECVEETGDVGHDAAFVWVGRVAEIFDFEELRDVKVFCGDLKGEAGVAMPVALVDFLIIQEIGSMTMDECTPDWQNPSAGGGRKEEDLSARTRRARPPSYMRNPAR
jgi:hypothetical protein